MYHITYEIDGTYRAILADADSMETAERIFRKNYPSARICGEVEVAHDYDMKPGKPVLRA